jgi:hypothetical protein
MHPTSTQYRLCQTPADYKACHAFFRQESKHPRYTFDNEGCPDYKQVQISYPTILAVRGNKVVGVMATRINPKWGVIGSPCHVAYDIKNHVPVLFRLIDCYEYFLRHAGIAHYTVIMPNFKPSGRRIWEELRQAELCRQIYNNRYNVYRVPLQMES